MGGKFECFALPYYDWTIDAGQEDDPFILNSVFGGDGKSDHNNCVGGQWTVDNWPLHELCGVGERAETGCCLKRDLWPEWELGNATDIGAIVEKSDFKQFEEGVASEHQKVHWLVGKGDECVSCAMATGYVALGRLTEYNNSAHSMSAHSLLDFKNEQVFPR